MYTQYETVIYSILSTIVSIACILGNLLVLVAFVLDRGVRSSNNYFIISLAFTDILIGLISINFFMLYLMLGYWPLGNIVCECWMAMDFTLCFISQVTVFMITIDRYLSVTHALRYRNWRTDNKLKVMLALSWILPTALWSTVIFGWYHFTDQERPPPTDCSVPFTHFTLFNTLLTVGYFWIPLVFITSLYVRIYNVAVRLQRKATTTEMGLAELMMMAGTTMSKIGLGMEAARSPPAPKEPKPESEPVNSSPQTHSTFEKLAKDSESRNVCISQISRGPPDSDCKKLRNARSPKKEEDAPYPKPNQETTSTKASSKSWRTVINVQTLAARIFTKQVNQFHWSAALSKDRSTETVCGLENSAAGKRLSRVAEPKSQDSSGSKSEVTTFKRSAGAKVPMTLRESLFRLQSTRDEEKQKLENVKRKRARKSLKMISFILGAYVVCWIPYHVVVLIKGVCDRPNESYSCVDVNLYNFAYFMCYMNSPINPFCYAFANVAFKQAFIRILKGDFKRY
ncbi:unnamed protein product [Dibothriocephalus latus]|uniref:G-protein coupled receptors family 1 profile domain-containing protein n=1 Tax=Dibothriocephalus latus TaxID=60516 RepID=A0A3P6V4S0_DIBLA|nr:unnamed protein product [Dibothriocephalus latus]